MLDIHSHILPGIDDGAPDLEASLALCRELRAQGVTHVVATPHWCSPRFSVQEEGIYRTWNALVAAAAGIAGLTLALGAEHHYSGLQDAKAFVASLRPLGDSRCVLIELPDDHLPNTIWDAMWQVKSAKFTPIIAHPERCKGLKLSDPGLRDFVFNGGLLQLTLGHLLGGNGLRMLWRSRVLFHKFHASCLIASDSHNLWSRRPRWDELPEKWRASVPRDLSQLVGWQHRSS